MLRSPSSNRWTLLALLAAASLAATALPAAAAPARQRPAASAAASNAAALQGDQRIVHALNRLAFGPRPGDVQRVRQIGLGDWIARQLEPDKLDDSVVTAKAASLRALSLPTDQLLDAYKVERRNQKQRKQKQLNKQRREASSGSALNPDTSGGAQTNGAQGNASQTNSSQANGAQAKAMDDEMAPERPLERPLVTSREAINELETAKVLRAVESNRQLQEVLVDFWSNHFNLDIKKGQVRTFIIGNDRDVIRPHVLGKFRDLLGATAKSPGMLFYLDNFRSTKEFDVAAQPGRRRRAALKLTGANQGATAAPNQAATNQTAAKLARRRGGINENYAREIMELHTLGVDGGYTQQDVQEVARCFTGWTFDKQTGEFRFRANAHDDGAKTVLGHAIAAGGGIQDGETVLDILSAHPSTAHHIARELCVRFISDEPPASIVDKAARTFLDSGGDLRAVMKTIIFSPEFFSTAAYKAKIKSPFEYAVSAVRALGGVMDLPEVATDTTASTTMASDTMAPNNTASNSTASGRSEPRFIPTSRNAINYKGKGNGNGRRRGRRTTMPAAIANMGEPLFSYQAPTGYPEDSREWVSAGALIARLNFALALSGGGIDEVSFDTQSPDSAAPINAVANDTATQHLEQMLDAMAARLLGTNMSPATRATLLKQAQQGQTDPARLTALVLGSPQFQRR